MPTTARVSGVYVFTNLLTGDCLVGSSLNLSVRLAYYFKHSTIATSNRLFFRHLRDYSFDCFTLDIYIVRKGYDSSEYITVLNEVLALEQYYIFTLNSTLNTIKVAGVGPQYIENETRNAAISRANSKQIYVYLNDVLVYKASSAVALSILTGISRGTISLSTSGKDKLVYGLYKLSFIGPNSSTLVSLLPVQEFLLGISKARNNYSHLPRPIVGSKIQQANTQKIGVTATDNITGKEYSYPSMTAMSNFTKTLGQDRYVSQQIISRSLIRKESYKYWTFCYSDLYLYL